jgi:hypothetical protein
MGHRDGGGCQLIIPKDVCDYVPHSSRSRSVFLLLMKDNMELGSCKRVQKVPKSKYFSLHSAMVIIITKASAYRPHTLLCLCQTSARLNCN